jgi:putative oxidoreductase
MMNKEVGIFLHRLIFGAMMLVPHGIPKFSKLLSNPQGFPDPLGIGSTFSLILVIFSEVICSILIIIGLKTRLAAIPLIITMVIAAFSIHGADPFSGKEKALLYLGAYLVLVFTGSGNFSIDHMLSSKKSKTTA